MKYLLFLLLFVVSSCGDDVYVSQNVVKTEERLAFSGYFQLNGPSSANCIYLDEKAPGVVDIESDCQSLVTINPKNGTLGQFPTITRTNLVVLNGEIRFTLDVNYTSGHDIEEDVSGSNIHDRRRTDVRLFFNENGKLVIKFHIYKEKNNSNLNEIVATRTFREL